ncbi:MAG: hypothetical protein AB1425_03090 [Actinomycetota bacterium]
MGFEEVALERLRRYRRAADRALALSSEAEEAARRFSERLFRGLERVAGLAERAGFDARAAREGDLFAVRLGAGPEDGALVTFGVSGGAAAETDEDLMHEELSRFVLDPSGYSGRIVAWSESIGEGPCQVVAVYRDGVWKTKGVLVERARGRIDDPDEVVDGFCLRILGRIADLAAPTEWAGRRWAAERYPLPEFSRTGRLPTETRWLR